MLPTPNDKMAFTEASNKHKRTPYIKYNRKNSHKTQGSTYPETIILFEIQNP